MDPHAAPLRLTVRRTRSTGPNAVAVSVTVPADVRYVEEAVELMARHCLSGQDPSRRTSFRVRVLLAEALTNSILFGSDGTAFTA